jgi:hypothetical protein
LIPAKAREIREAKFKVGDQYHFAHTAPKRKKVVVDKHKACMNILADGTHLERVLRRSRE